MAYRWTQQEIEYIKTHWQTMSDRAMAAHLGKSTAAVLRRRCSCGLLKRGTRTRWSQTDIEKLQALWDTSSIQDVAKALGRSVPAVVQKAQGLRLKTKIDMDHLSLERLAHLMGYRKINAVSGWLDMGLPAEETRAGKDVRYMINMQDVLVWLKANPDKWDSRRVALNALGEPEPQWLTEKRKSDRGREDDLRPWTDQELQYLQEQAKLGIPHAVIAYALRRSKSSVSSKWYVLQHPSTVEREKSSERRDQSNMTHPIDLIHNNELTSVRGIVYQSREQFITYMFVDQAGIIHATPLPQRLIIQDDFFTKTPGRTMLYRYARQNAVMSSADNGSPCLNDEKKMARFMCQYTNGLPIDMLPAFIGHCIKTKFSGPKAEKYIQEAKASISESDEKRRKRAALGMNGCIKNPIISIDKVSLYPDHVLVYLLMHSMMTKEEQKQYVAENKQVVQQFIYDNTNKNTRRIYKLEEILSQQCTLTKFSMPYPNIVCLHYQAHEDAIPLVTEPLDDEDMGEVME